MPKKLNSDEKHARKVAEARTFLDAYGRKKRPGGLDPNDRQYDRKVEESLARMKPEALDELLRDE